VQDLSRTRAEQHAQSGLQRKDGPCSALAIDLRTGSITEGVNGKTPDVISPENLHPLLRDNYRGIGDWQHPVRASETELVQAPKLDENGKGMKDADGNVVKDDWIMQGRAHPDDPLRHAEVKATNELLWERQRAHEDAWRAEHGADSTPPPLSREALDDMRVDPRWIKEQMQNGEVVSRVGDEAFACSNCNAMLHGVDSYTGRSQFSPHDYRFRQDDNLIPPVTE
jgi:hypothetical protein